MGRRKKIPKSDKAPGAPGAPTGPNDPDAEMEIVLSDNEQIFVDEYLVHRNSLRAYRVAFPNSTYATARARSYEVRHRPCVAREIAAALYEQQMRTRITADAVLREIARVAFSDVYDLYDPVTQQLYHPRHVPYETRKAIASMKVCRERNARIRGRGPNRARISDTVIEYKLWDKMSALSKLCSHLGLETEITPLEALLRALPTELATAVRESLSERGTIVAPSKNGVH